MTINHQKQFKEPADRMASEPIAEWALERRVLRHLWTIDGDMGKVARANRERTIEHVLAVFRGRGAAGDTTGNGPGTKSVAFNADRRVGARAPGAAAGATRVGPTRSSGPSGTADRSSERSSSC